MTLKQTLLFLFMLTFSCGPGTETNNGGSVRTNNDTTTDQEMIVRTTMTIDETDTSITATAMNQDGSEVAIATKNLRTFEEKVRIYSTIDGSELREMSDFSLPDNAAEGNVISVENLFWSESNKLTALQSFRHRFIWDSVSGDLIEKKASSEVTDKCAGPRGGVFHPKFNEAFVSTVAVPADNTLCKINFDTNTSQIVTLTEGPVVQSFVLDTTGEKLWVSFSDPTDANAFSKEIVNTVAYDARTLAPLVDSITTDGVLILEGPGFFIAQTLLQHTLVPGGAFDAQTDISAPPGGEVVLSQFGGRLSRFIAMPSGTVIGTIARDSRHRRSFSGDGKVATVVDFTTSEVSIVEVDTRTAETAIVEPKILTGTLSGSVTIDGVQETLAGTCELISDADLGPVQFLARGTTGSGWDIQARSQNLLLNSYYGFTKAGQSYFNTTAIAQNLMIDSPMAACTIEGGGTLFAFEKYELFERVVDAGHTSGFKAVDFVLNGICTP